MLSGKSTGKSAVGVASDKCHNSVGGASSHNLDQVFRLADRICALRRGVQVGVKNTAETDKNEIVAMITGLA